MATAFAGSPGSAAANNKAREPSLIVVLHLPDSFVDEHSAVRRPKPARRVAFLALDLDVSRLEMALSTEAVWKHVERS